MVSRSHEAPASHELRCRSVASTRKVQNPVFEFVASGQLCDQPCPARRASMTPLKLQHWRRQLQPDASAAINSAGASRCQIPTESTNHTVIQQSQPSREDGHTGWWTTAQLFDPTYICAIQGMFGAEQVVEIKFEESQMFAGMDQCGGGVKQNEACFCRHWWRVLPQLRVRGSRALESAMSGKASGRLAKERKLGSR